MCIYHKYISYRKPACCLSFMAGFRYRYDLSSFLRPFGLRNLGYNVWIWSRTHCWKPFCVSISHRSLLNLRLNNWFWQSRLLHSPIQVIHWQLSHWISHNLRLWRLDFNKNSWFFDHFKWHSNSSILFYWKKFRDYTFLYALYCGTFWLYRKLCDHSYKSSASWF